MCDLARTVEDVVAKDGSILGTKVGDRVLSIDPDTISPLQRALDYEMTQTLFIGRHTLLVEGSSDLAYLKWFSNQLKKKNRTSLDYRWTICVVGGADRIPGFTSLFRGNGLQIAALVDYANGMKQRIQNAKAVLGDKRVLTADTYAGQPEADIEDILGKEFYVALVNKAYRLIGSDMFISPATGRLIKHVEDHFRILPSTYDEFDHYKPAGWLFEANDEGAALPGIDGALDRMEKVIRDLNALVPA